MPPIEKLRFGRPVYNDDARRFVALCSFTRMILLEGCSNACTDSIRAYLRRKIGDEDNMGITAADISMLWEFDVGSKLRACLCLAMALRIKHLHERYILAQDILELVWRDGDLAVTFTKSLVFCHRDLHIGAEDVLCSTFDCLFHDHRETEPCSIPKTSEWKMIAEIREALEYVV